jgi:hypothetical protein
MFVWGLVGRSTSRKMRESVRVSVAAIEQDAGGMTERNFLPQHWDWAELVMRLERR